MATTRASRQPQPMQYDVEDSDDLYPTRMPSSVRRYKPQDTLGDPEVQKGTLIHRRRASLNGQQTQGFASNAVAPSRDEVREERQGLRIPGLQRRRFSLVTLLVGAIVTMLLIMTFSVLISWWHTYQDDMHYGRPRTSQMDAVVGHNDSPGNPTHFIFINLHGHIQIIEIPGGDASRTRIYTGPTLFGDGQDLVPVTGEIRDDNGKHDLVVHIQNQQLLFTNDGTTFHPPAAP